MTHILSTKEIIRREIGIPKGVENSLGIPKGVENAISISIASGADILIRNEKIIFEGQKTKTV